MNRRQFLQRGVMAAMAARMLPAAAALPADPQVSFDGLLEYSASGNWLEYSASGNWQGIAGPKPDMKWNPEWGDRGIFFSDLRQSNLMYPKGIR